MKRRNLDQRAAVMNWKIPALTAALFASLILFRVQDSATPASKVLINSTQTQSSIQPGAMARYMEMLREQSTHQPSANAVPAWMSKVLNVPAQALTKDFEQLRALPDGDAAIALSKQLEADISAQNIGGYVRALLVTDHSTVERVALSALARAADASTIVELASYYGSLPAERRGRILSVLEGVENPEAAAGLAAIVAVDTSEKRSPLMMSALYGMANTGTMDTVQYLLGQLATDNFEYAVMALGRVTSAQGINLIRSAAQGSKDTETVPVDRLPALHRIAEATAK